MAVNPLGRPESRQATNGPEAVGLESVVVSVVHEQVTSFLP
ncbi:hypothetical protein SAMN04487974_11386 [Pelagibacterium luteolum]|uniref:Uncharacterized protein n=1 Tax=Pelagibacterium luteolum TaxID=440168 RepID=A0A1G7YEP5_9HYPH|nr:hypothetical protein SAMN04487974_11386 [Pelagibacterium luteolum]